MIQELDTLTFAGLCVNLFLCMLWLIIYSFLITYIIRYGGFKTYWLNILLLSFAAVIMTVMPIRFVTGTLNYDDMYNFGHSPLLLSITIVTVVMILLPMRNKEDI